jgi:multicomponent Na+:H+ antiporter subunit A
MFMGLALGAILLPFISAFFMPFLYGPLGRRLGVVALVVGLGALTMVILAPSGAAGTIAWVPQLGIDLALQVDGWGRLLALLISGIGVLVLLYSIMYLGKQEDLGKFYMYILLFMGAMLGVVLSANLMGLYIFWELTSISSFLLIGFWYTRESGQYGALKSMILTVSGGLAMLAGIILLGEIAGTYDMATLIANKDAILADPLSGVAMVLILIGAFSKSAQVPFHIWLPDAMSAPTPVSAYLHSATMVKAGLFLVARLWPIFATHIYWTGVVANIGLLTMVTGAYLALQKTDLKAILALSTISQLGLIMALFGFGTEGAAAAGVFHLLNHSTFKGLLFMVVGIIDHETGTRDITRLSGLRKSMPISFILAAIGAASMAGVPPLNGFISKEMFLEASLHGPFGVPGELIAVGSSMLTVVYCLILAHKIWFGPETHDTPKHPHEAPWLMLLPPGILAVLVVAIGVYPGLVEYSIVKPAILAVTQVPPDLHLALWHGFNIPLLMSGIALAGGLVGYLNLERLVKVFRRWAPEKYNSNNLYDWLWWKDQVMEKTAKRITAYQMTGLLRDYLVFILGAAVLGLVSTLWMKGINVTGLDLAPIEIHEYVLLGVIVAGGLAAVLSRTRLMAIVAIALVGLPLSLFFALMGAPDLALTQLVVEVVTSVLFLLVFAQLPQMKIYPRRPVYQDINVVVAIGVGVVATIFTLLANAERAFGPDAAEWMLANSYEGGGGTNVVNVTLVDFRGIDTLGEITVLAVAALAVYMLIKVQLAKGGRNP